MRSKKNKKKLLIAIVLGVVATMSVFNMINNQTAQINNLNQRLAQQSASLSNAQTPQASTVKPEDEIINAVLAKTDIKSGEIIKINKIEKKEYKKNELPPGYFYNESFVLGKIASQDILVGKIITNEDILSADESSLNIPPGMRAITIPTSLFQGLASYIYIGSKIDIISIKSPPEFIAQNVKIIALETDPRFQQVENIESAPPPAAQPAPPTQPGQPVASAAVPASPPPAPPRVKKNISADKAMGITILVPFSTAQKITDAMIAGKLQVITRGNNDNKIVKQTSYVSINHLKTTSLLPPPPSGTGKLPSLPGVITNNPPSPPAEPKVEVEVIEANNKRQVSFDDTSSNTGSVPSKDLKELLKLSN